MEKEALKHKAELLIKGALKSEAKKQELFEIHNIVEAIRAYAEVPRYNFKQKIAVINAHFLFKLTI